MNPHTILLIREGCGLVGLLLGCVGICKLFHAGWFQITLKKPLDVRMSEPEAEDITLQQLLTQAREKHVVRADFQRGNFK